MIALKIRAWEFGLDRWTNEIVSALSLLGG